MLRRLLLSVLGVGLVLAAAPACGDGEAPSGQDCSSASSGSSWATTLSGEARQGIATFYDYSGSSEVACGFDITSDTAVAAINAAEYAASAACGACVTVSGPKGKITVRIVDLCPCCENNHLDLSEQAFAKIAAPADGRAAITYELAPCNVSGNMSYRIKEGSSESWTAIQVRNHKLPIAKLEYEKGGVYVAMPRVDFNYFVDERGVGDRPSGVALRITATDGQAVEDTLPSVRAGKVFAGTVQFK